MNKRKILTYSAIAIASILLFCSLGYTEKENVSVVESSKITQLPIPDSAYIFGERVPLENFDTRESLEREILVNVYWQSNTSQFIKKADRYFPIIDSILTKNGITLDFKYLAVAESGLRNVVSPASAAGLWQFLEKTGRECGLEVNQYIDERYHLEKSTEAACKYLKKAYEKFNNWSLVAASYNIGVVGIQKQLNYQYIDSYWDLYTNQETGRYVFRILALKLIMENPEDYGFYYKPEEKYPTYSYKTITIDTTISDVAAFVNSHGSNYKMMKELNPWIRSKSIPNEKRKSYTIKLITDSVRKTL